MVKKAVCFFQCLGYKLNTTNKKALIHPEKISVFFPVFLVNLKNKQ